MVLISYNKGRAYTAFLLLLASSTIHTARADEDVGLCCLCKGCDAVASGRDYLLVNEAGTTCTEILLEMADTENESLTGNGPCISNQQRYRQTCCDASYTPPEIAQAPTPAPVLNLPPQGDEPVCNLCPDASFPGLPKTVTAVLYIAGNPTCEQLYYFGLKGLIQDRLCNPLQDYLFQDCGCDRQGATTGLAPIANAAPPVVVQVTNSAPTRAPTPAPTRAPSPAPTRRPVAAATTSAASSPVLSTNGYSSVLDNAGQEDGIVNVATSDKNEYVLFTFSAGGNSNNNQGSSGGGTTNAGISPSFDFSSVLASFGGSNSNALVTDSSSTGSSPGAAAAAATPSFDFASVLASAFGASSSNNEGDTSSDNGGGASSNTSSSTTPSRPLNSIALPRSAP